MVGLDIDTLNTELKVKTCILKAKSNFTLFIYIHFQDICE